MLSPILIVDDEEAILFAMCDYFTILGYRVDGARELGEAKALLAQTSYAVVIADLRLTGSHDAEGLELVEYVRQRQPSTRAILLTAYGSPEIEGEARQRGVDAFLHKRLSLPEVAQVVAGLLRGGEGVLSPGGP